MEGQVLSPDSSENPLLAGTAGSPGSLRPASLFFSTAIATAVACGFGLLLFPAEAGLVAIFLITFARESTVEALLDRNRAEIYGGSHRPEIANSRLAAALLLIFAGVFVAYVAAVQILPADRLGTLFEVQLGAFASASPADLRFGSQPALLLHNLGVAATCLLFAVFYRHAGLLFVLAWNASRWGVVFSFVARGGTDLADGLSRLFRIATAVLPHLSLEAVAYALVAMGGVFLSKALVKYPLDSAPFWRVVRAVFGLVTVALVALAAAAWLESNLAPKLVSRLFG